jgi:L-ascorbate metabolism protein UlaG (beta-lactamase superfamily)
MSIENLPRKTSLGGSKMLIKWLGHASFLITSQSNQRIITDPYTTDTHIFYNPINESAEIVTMSHGHCDHNNVKIIKGSPKILTEAAHQRINGIEIKAIPVFHDGTRGSQRGNNLIFCFKVDGLNLCHLGDLGHRLSPQQISEIEPVDVLFIPVGGFFTVDAMEATEIAHSIKPKLIFPMHYKTPKTDYPLAAVDEFIKDKKDVRRLDVSEIEINKNSLPERTEIIILQSAN